MTEVLFILVAIIVAYVIYVIVSEQKITAHSPVSQAKPEKSVATVKPSTPQSAPKIEKVAAVKSVGSARMNAGTEHGFTLRTYKVRSSGLLYQQFVQIQGFLDVIIGRRWETGCDFAAE